MCSLRFENSLLTFEGVRFASISKKTPLSKLSFALVLLALPLLHMTLLHILVTAQEQKQGDVPCSVAATELNMPHKPVKVQTN